MSISLRIMITEMTSTPCSGANRLVVPMSRDLRDWIRERANLPLWPNGVRVFTEEEDSEDGLGRFTVEYTDAYERPCRFCQCNELGYILREYWARNLSLDEERDAICSYLEKLPQYMFCVLYWH